jgi:flagellar basal-body rod protein FlgG
MIRALYTAASGMSAQQMNLDTIANNLANSSTTGFRQLRLQFQDMVYQNLVTPGAAQSQSTVGAGLQIGLGTKSAATEVIMTQGSLNQTSNPLDVAIEGSGFFQVQRPDGTIAYTRAGQFHLNNQGTIVTTDGDPLIPTITIPPNATAVTITQSGRPGKPGIESSSGDVEFGRSCAGQPGRNRRAGDTPARVSREFECGRGHRVCADGAGATSV